MNPFPFIDAAEYFLSLKQADGAAVPVAENGDEGLLHAMAEAARSKLGLAIAYRVYSESLRDPSASAVGEHFKEHSEDCLNDVDFFVRRSSVMTGGVTLDGVEAPPPAGDLTEIIGVLTSMEEANLHLMGELLALLDGNPAKYEVEAMMAKDQHHLDDLVQHTPVAGAAAAGVGAPKLDEVKTSEMGAAAMGRHPQVSPPPPLTGAAAGQHAGLAAKMAGAVKEALKSQAKNVRSHANRAKVKVNLPDAVPVETAKERSATGKLKDFFSKKTWSRGEAAALAGVSAGGAAGATHAAHGDHEHAKAAAHTYDMSGSKQDGRAYSMHTTPDEYELSTLINSKMDGDLRGVRGKAKNEGVLVGSGLGAVKGLKAGKGWGGGQVIRTGGGDGTVIGVFGSGGKMPKGMGAAVRENQGMIRDELRGQGIKVSADKSDSELAEAGRQRAIANLASGFTSDKHTSGERHGTLVGRLGGAALGAGAGTLASRGATLPVRLAAGMGGAVIGGSMGGQIGKTIGSNHDAARFWEGHKEAGVLSSLAARPKLVGGLAGAAVGGVGGAVAGGPEHRLSGALGGAALGGAVGTGVGAGVGRLRAAPKVTAQLGAAPVAPTPGKSLTMLGGEELATKYQQAPESYRKAIEATDLVQGIGTPNGIKMQPHNAAVLMSNPTHFMTASQRRNARLQAEAAAMAAVQAAPTKVAALFRPSNMKVVGNTIIHGEKEMDPRLGKRKIRDAKQIWNKVKEAMDAAQYLQIEGAGQQAQAQAETDYLHDQLQQTSQQLEEASAQSQAQSQQLEELQDTVEQMKAQQAEQAQAADAAVETARQTAEAAMSQSMQRSAELMKQIQVAAQLQNAQQTLKEQLAALSNMPSPPATVSEAGAVESAAQGEVGAQAAEAEAAAAAQQEQEAMAAQGQQSAPPAQTPAAPPKVASLGDTAGKILSKAPHGTLGAVIGAGVGAGTGLLQKQEQAFLQDAVQKLEQRDRGGFATGMALAKARMWADQSQVAGAHPVKATLYRAGKGAIAGFGVERSVRSLLGGKGGQA